MRYIQLVEFDTNHPVHEVQQALDAWLAASRGKRTLHMAVVAADHDRANHYWELLEYASEQEALKTAELPETKQWVSHCTSSGRFGVLCCCPGGDGSGGVRHSRQV